jgi:hypothetical protein
MEDPIWEPLSSGPHEAQHRATVDVRTAERSPAGADSSPVEVVDEWVVGSDLIGWRQIACVPLAPGPALAVANRAPAARRRDADPT